MIRVHQPAWDDSRRRPLLAAFLATPFAQELEAQAQPWRLVDIRRDADGVVTATLRAEPDGRPVLQYHVSLPDQVTSASAPSLSS
jgi:hypothetical protein